jgi:hypothetical protein
MQLLNEGSHFWRCEGWITLDTWTLGFLGVALCYYCCKDGEESNYFKYIIPSLDSYSLQITNIKPYGHLFRKTPSLGSFHAVEIELVSNGNTVVRQGN